MFNFIKYLFGFSHDNKIYDDLDVYDYELLDEEEENMPKKIIVDFSKFDVVSIHYQNGYVVINHLVKYTNDTVAFENHSIFIEDNSQYDDVISQYQEYIKAQNDTDTIDKTA